LTLALAAIWTLGTCALAMQEWSIEVLGDSGSVLEDCLVVFEASSDSAECVDGLITLDRGEEARVTLYDEWEQEVPSHEFVLSQANPLEVNGAFVRIVLRVTKPQETEYISAGGTLSITDCSSGEDLVVVGPCNGPPADAPIDSFASEEDLTGVGDLLLDYPLALAQLDDILESLEWLDPSSALESDAMVSLVDSLWQLDIDIWPLLPPPMLDGFTYELAGEIMEEGSLIGILLADLFFKHSRGKEPGLKAELKEKSAEFLSYAADAAAEAARHYKSAADQWIKAARDASLTPKQQELCRDNAKRCQSKAKHLMTVARNHRISTALRLRNAAMKYKEAGMNEKAITACRKAVDEALKVPGMKLE